MHIYIHAAVAEGLTFEVYNITITTISGATQVLFADIYTSPQEVGYEGTKVHDGDPTTYWSTGIVPADTPIAAGFRGMNVPQIQRVRIIQTPASGLQSKTATFKIYMFEGATLRTQAGVLIDQEDFSWYPGPYTQ